MNKQTELEIKKAIEAMIYPVYCRSCDWFGMNDDCHHGECPNCGGYVERERSSDAIRNVDGT